MSFNDWFSSIVLSRQPISIPNDFKFKYFDRCYLNYCPWPIIENIAPCSVGIHRSSRIDEVQLRSLSIIERSIHHQSRENRARIQLQRCVTKFLNLIDQTSIRDFLEYDKDFRHADKFLLAMALIYFHRAKLREHHFTKDSFYLALWLAHDSVEEDLTAKYGLLPWALQTHDDHPSVDLKNDFKQFLTKKNDLWTRMAFRARVTKDECEQIISIQPNHWIWQRERNENYYWKFLKNQRSNLDENQSCSSSSTVSPSDDIRPMMIIDRNADDTDEIISFFD